MARSVLLKKRHLLVVVVVVCSLAVAACGKKGDAAATAEPSASARATTSGDSSTSTAVSDAALGKLKVGNDSLFMDDAAVVEGFDEGSAAFAVAAEGPVKVAVADADGKPVSATDRTASLTYEIPETGKTIEVPLKADADKSYLVATGPELSKSVVTPVKYSISGGARPWTGYLQLPAGGTKALNADAQLAATAHLTPPVGPHGGRIERIGNDDVEFLMDKTSGELRAWIIVDGKAIDPGDRRFAVVLDDRRVELRADANASFYAHVSADAGFHLGEVHKISGELFVGIGDAASVNVVLFGLRPHVYVYAPRVVVDVEVDNWTKEKRAKWILHPDDDDDHDHDHHDNGRHIGWGDHGRHDDDRGGWGVGAGVGVHVGGGGRGEGHGHGHGH